MPRDFLQGTRDHYDVVVIGAGGGVGSFLTQLATMRGAHVTAVVSPAKSAIARELGAPATVQAFSEKLFRERSWGPMAESETYAHLEHLRLSREAEAHRNEKGRLVYDI